MEVGVSNECWNLMVKHLHMNKFENSGAGVWCGNNETNSFHHWVIPDTRYYIVRNKLSEGWVLYSVIVILLSQQINKFKAHWTRIHPLQPSAGTL